MEFKQYLANELSNVESVAGPLKICICGENGIKTKWINIPHTAAELLEILAPTAPAELLHFTRVNNDGNGNPRFVLHYTQLLRDDEHGYETALSHGRKIGGRKFHNKSYGGGIVFSSYNLNDEVTMINKILGGDIYAGYDID